jgi:hypothetical protein
MFRKVNKKLEETTILPSCFVGLGAMEPCAGSLWSACLGEKPGRRPAVGRGQGGVVQKSSPKPVRGAKLSHSYFTHSSYSPFPHIHPHHREDIERGLMTKPKLPKVGSVGLLALM